jgi:peptide/nickel transport system substrate-binding protein
MRQWLWILLILLACQPADRHPDKAVFYYNESAGISSLDPAFANNLENIWWVSQIYEGLVEMDDELSIRPALAESWTVSEDGLEFTFRLKSDIRFHPHELLPADRNVTAHDVAYSFQRVMDPETSSPGRWVFDKLDPELPMEVLDEQHIRLRLKDPFPPFLGMLSMPYCFVVPHEVVEHYGDDFRSNPVGTGPFRMNFWMEGVSLALLKNEQYHQHDGQGMRLPYLDAVSVSFVPDKTTMFLDFLKGRYDMISGLHKAYRNELLDSNGELAEAYADRYYLEKKPSLKTDYLGILVDDSLMAGSPLLDARVRKAMDLAIDRRQMVRYIKNNTAIPAFQGFVPPSCFLTSTDKEVEMTRFDIKQSKQLLADAGFPNGKGLPTITLSTTSDYVELCEYIQFQLEQVGFPIKVDVLPTSLHRQGVSAGDIGFFRKSWIADYSDAENFLALYYGPNASPKGSNYTRFQDAEFDSLYVQALRSSDPLLRDSLYHRMNGIVQHEVPVIPLFYDMVMRFISKDVSGVKGNAMNQLDLRRVRKETKEDVN